MVTCAGIESVTDPTVANLLAYPTTCDFLFYAKIMAGFFIILAVVLYYNEKMRKVDPDMISCLGVSGLATVFVTLIGTLVGFIQTEVFIIITVACLIFIVIWMLKR